jgi:hypothetical protein
VCYVERKDVLACDLYFGFYSTCSLVINELKPIVFSTLLTMALGLSICSLNSIP